MTGMQGYSNNILKAIDAIRQGKMFLLLIQRAGKLKLTLRSLLRQ